MLWVAGERKYVIPQLAVNFIQAVRARDAGILNCDIEEGHKSAVLNHLAMAAYRIGRVLSFDPKAERFVDDDEANAWLSRPQRTGFETV